MSSYSRQQLEDWVKTIEVPANSRVLDVGGSQLPVNSRLKNIGKDCEFKILDLEQPHECKLQPDIIEDLNEIQYAHDSTFDYAFCLEVSEYWYDPIRALSNICGYLKPSGILYISFHFIYPVHNPVEQDYLRYTEIGAKKLLENAGFIIEEVKPRVLNTYIANIDGMRPAKQYDKHDWSGCLIKAKKV